MFIALFMTHNSDEEMAIISSIRENALTQQDKVKLKIIESATQMFLVERGHSAPSLDDLVRTGYLEPQDILDHNGKKFAFTPENITYDTTITMTSKSCGGCGKSVPGSSRAGDRCPHCGVKWGSEQVMYTF